MTAEIASHPRVNYTLSHAIHDDHVVTRAVQTKFISRRYIVTAVDAKSIATWSIAGRADKDMLHRRKMQNS